jgi:hypothetical protein
MKPIEILLSRGEGDENLFYYYKFLLGYFHYMGGIHSNSSN